MGCEREIRDPVLLGCQAECPKGYQDGAIGERETASSMDRVLFGEEAESYP